MTSDPSPGPADVDVSEVTSRLPAANVVFTSRPGSKGFAFPPLPLAGGAVPTPRPDADAPIPLDPAAGPARPPDGPMVAALPDGPLATALPDGPSAIATALPDGPLATALPDGPLATALPDGPLATALPDGPLATALPDGPLATTPPAGPDEPAAPPSGVPVSPGPIGPAPDPDDLPSGEALGAEIDEIAAELSAQAPAAQTAPRRPDTGEWRGIVLVTGTDTDVGKTIVTAAVAAAALASGLRVAVIKPGQTGLAAGAPTDIEVINRLAGPDTARTLAEYPEPMAPLPAATIASMPPLELYEVVDAIRAEADKHDLVLVEGAGGLLVPMGVRPSGEAWTLADLATTLGVRTIVVARAGLGTLNHTALTLEALARRGVPAGVVIGAWPADPELVHWANLSELLPHLVGALPEGAGRMDPGVFRRSAPGWLTPALYGVLDNWRVWAEDTGDGHH